VRFGVWLTVEGAAQAGQLFAVEGIPHPFAAPVTVNQTGVSEDLQVVGDGSLALADGFDELAHTDFAFGGDCEHGQKPETDWITKGAETGGQPDCLVAIEGSRQDRGAAFEFVFDLDDSLRSGQATLPLTIVDVSVIINVSTCVDVIGGVACPAFNLL
jgi:hypothetical protein